MESGGGGPGVPDGRRKSSRIPRLNSKFQNTDAEDRLSQILGSQEENDEEELRVGADGVIARLQAVDEEVVDEPPGLIDAGGQDESDMEDMEENEEGENVEVIQAGGNVEGEILENEEVNVEVNGDAPPAQHHPHGRVDLRPFVNAAVPGPVPAHQQLQDPDGWAGD